MPATASTSRTGSATGWGWTDTSRPTSSAETPGRSPPEIPSRSSPASTFPTISACASRTIQACEQERAEGEGEDVVVRFLEADDLAAEGGGEKEPLALEEDAAVGADASEFEVTGIFGLGQL